MPRPLLALFAFLTCTAPALAQAHEPDPVARRIFAELIESYRARPALTVKTKVTIELTQGEHASSPREVEAEISFNADKTGIVKLRGFTCLLAGGTLTAFHEESDETFYSAPDDGSPYYALMNEFMEIPFPHLAIGFGERDMDGLLMQFHQMAPWLQPTGVGEVVKDGRAFREIVLTSDFARLTILVDPRTKLMHSAVLEVTGGRMVQPGATLRYKHAFEYTVHDKPIPAEALAFDPGERRREDSLIAMMPRPEAPPMGGELGGEPDRLVGREVPELSLQTIDGGLMDLKQEQGKVIVLDFWATWCRPCREALPGLHEVAQWARDQQVPVAFYTINLFEGASDEQRLKNARAFWSREGFTLPVAMDYKDRSAALFGISALPVTVIVRPDGIVHAKHVGIPPVDYVTFMQREITEALGVE